jgi:2-oxo-4-hydroxy-4-carboxy--5-ureidoimidazoline (OHCU) decarboxylase
VPGAGRRSVDELDGLPDDACIAALAPLFEGAPRFLARLCAARPFGSEAGLFATAREIARSMPLDEQVELVEAHPRLGAPAASVSAMSFVEQGYDRPVAEQATAAEPLASDEAAAAAESERARVAIELERLNAAYEARFGFRYCVFVAGRERVELLPEFEAALDADGAAEVARAVDAVIDIAADRWAKVVRS